MSVAFGIISDVKSAAIVKLSVSASPRLISPPIVISPCTVASPDTNKVPTLATVKFASGVVNSPTVNLGETNESSASSVNSPSAPENVTLVSVRSETLAVLNVASAIVEVVT